MWPSIWRRESISNILVDRSASSIDPSSDMNGTSRAATAITYRVPRGCLRPKIVIINSNHPSPPREAGGKVDGISRLYLETANAGLSARRLIINYVRWRRHHPLPAIACRVRRTNGGFRAGTDGGLSSCLFASLIHVL